MSDNTKIEWTDATVNAVNGCSLASPGCTNCYAMRLAGTRLRDHPSRAGLTKPSKAGPVWTGKVRLNDTALLQPLRWKRPRRIFWNAHGDLFHPAVPDEWIDRCFAVMALTPQHIHQVLTKRPERMREYLSTACGRIADTIMRMRREMGDNDPIAPLPHILPGAQWWPLPNVWLGTSVEDQTRADERIPHLLATPAAVRFLSAEPLLGPVDLNRIHRTFDGGLGHSWESALNGRRFSAWGGADGNGGDIEGCPKIDWVIVGGESGPGARPMHPDWARSLRDQCAAAGVPFFFKQWGEWRDRGGHVPIPMRNFQSHIRYLDVDTGLGKPNPNRFSDETMIKLGKKAAGRLLDGVEHEGLPA
jgi:protein gp37